MGAAPIFYLLTKEAMQKNIERVFQSSLSLADKKRLYMAYYSHMLTSIKEIILYSLLSKKYLEMRVKIIGFEHLENTLS